MAPPAMHPGVFFWITSLLGHFPAQAPQPSNCASSLAILASDTIHGLSMPWQTTTIKHASNAYYRWLHLCSHNRKYIPPMKTNHPNGFGEGMPLFFIIRYGVWLLICMSWMTFVSILSQLLVGIGCIASWECFSKREQNNKRVPLCRDQAAAALFGIQPAILWHVQAFKTLHTLQRCIFRIVVKKGSIHLCRVPQLHPFLNNFSISSCASQGSLSWKLGDNTWPSLIEARR